MQSWFTQEKRGRCEFQHTVSEAEVTRRPPQSLSTAAGVGSPRALLEDLVSPK